MSRIVLQIVTLSQHLLTLEQEPDRYRPFRCPFCGLAGKIHAHGFYRRKANRHREPGVPAEIAIPRFFCAECKKACSRLPECLPPRRWYQWVVQQALLTVRLMGESIRKAAKRIKVARQTGRRWWGWLQAKTDRFAFYLKDHCPDLGRTVDLSGFWGRFLADHSLSSAMVLIDQQGVIVP